MSRKFFTLISGKELTVAPGKRRIPREQFSQGLDALELQHRVQQEADAYRLQVTKECETQKTQGYQEGYEEGYQKWTESLSALEQEIRNVHEELQKLIIPVALKAAKKIIGKEVELHPEVVVDIVASTLKAVSQHKKITIYVSRKDLDLLDQQKGRLKELFECLESFSLKERSDVEPGGCIIESEIGIVNGQMTHRLDLLTQAFEKAAKQLLPNTPP